MSHRKRKDIILKKHMTVTKMPFISFWQFRVPETITLFWKNDQIIFTNIISILIAYYSQNAHVSTQKLRLDGCR